jgi:hypothetical protein
MRAVTLISALVFAIVLASGAQSAKGHLGSISPVGTVTPAAAVTWDLAGVDTICLTDGTCGVDPAGFVRVYCPSGGGLGYTYRYDPFGSGTWDAEWIVDAAAGATCSVTFEKILHAAKKARDSCYFGNRYQYFCYDTRLAAIGSVTVTP